MIRNLHLSKKVSANDTSKYKLAFILFFVLLLGNIGILNAQTNYTWDAIPSNSVVNDGAGSTWTGNYWTTNNGVGNVAWANNNNAIFGAKNGTAGTITLGGNRTVNALTFNFANSGSYSLSGNTITFRANPFTANVNADASISSVLAGTATRPLIKNGNAVLTLSGANTYSGGTTINSGSIIVRNKTALGTGAVTVANGATLDIRGYEVANAITVNSGGTWLRYPTGDLLSNAANWQINKNSNASPSLTNGILTTTTNASNQSASAYYKTRIREDASFVASFDYVCGGNRIADGFTFILQNNSLTALQDATNGYGGHGLGWQGINNSVAITFDIYNTNGLISLANNGSYGTTSSVAPVVLNSGNTIGITITYDATAQTLKVDLTEANTTNTLTNTYTGVNISTTIGSNLAYAGFTSATGGLASTQTFSNFTLVPVTIPSQPLSVTATAGANSSVNLSWSAPSDNGGSAITD